MLGLQALTTMPDSFFFFFFFFTFFLDSILPTKLSNWTSFYLSLLELRYKALPVSLPVYMFDIPIS